MGESRHLYDQLAVLSPVLLALTAATPIARGALLDQDVRWNMIAGSVDDRTPDEQAGRRLPSWHNPPLSPPAPSTSGARRAPVSR